MGPIGQAAAPCVSDSAPVSDDRPGRVIQSSWRGTKRTHPKPESADSLTAVKIWEKWWTCTLRVWVQSELQKCWRAGHFFRLRMPGKSRWVFLTVLLSDIVETETTVREALSDGIDLSPVSPADPTKMPSDKWLTSLSKSKRIIDLKLSLLTQQKLLEEFLRDCQWVNAYIQSSQVNVMQTRRHLRCPVKGQAFVDWFKQQRNSFDTQALKEYGWLKMNAFIDGCLHVVPSSGQQFPFTDHFKGAVVLETIDFSVSDLSKFGKDDPIPHHYLN